MLLKILWRNHSLSYLCSIFQNLESGDDYSQIKPVYHIGILDFSPFPQYPEFYSTNKMMNIKKHYIYNDNFTLNVLDLNHIELATNEDKTYKINYWAKLFKAKTMPIKFLKASGKGFFIDKEGYALAIREDLRAVVKNHTFCEHMKDILEYRTMDYYRRRYKGE